ncbi:hybrid sensor histidine kinase/response regulator [Petrocella sp. FN5]|uniref:hybrid sensor histidine kinase/response regulator n=1 Tax=Petrocella sp. FN5 TaxID=3032002 RepID=UPI0023DB22AD|nr:PAS domain-containing sensor histidine kinase [Petrocella sp. FN5]MDF1617811.1 ATP-binding protein [Petrocella sp. FN5]
MNGTDSIKRPIDHNMKVFLFVIFYIPIVASMIYMTNKMELGIVQGILILFLSIIYLFIPSYLYLKHRKKEQDRINQAIDEMMALLQKNEVELNDNLISVSRYKEVKQLADLLTSWQSIIEEKEKQLVEEKEKYKLLYRNMVEQSVHYETNELWIERIIENSYDGLMITDSVGKVIRCNEALLHLFAIPKDRLSIYDYCYEIFHEKDKVCENCNNAYIHRTGIKQSRLIDFEDRIIDQLTIPVYDNQKSISAFIKTYRDVTEQKKLEFKVNRSTKMEAIGRLTSGISHDFNNILQVILGYSDLVHYHLVKSEQYELVAKVKNIREAAYKAEGLIQKLMIFSKMDRVHKEILSINTSVEEIGHMLERIIGERISLKLELDYQVENIIADKTQMEQIIVNLCVNAKDAIGESGKIRIRTYNVMKKSGQFVCLEVSDNGSGIYEDIQNKVFEPFFTTKELGEGTGLGLATVLGIVESHGGTIELDSVVGRGTTFKILFPNQKTRLVMIDQHKEHHVPSSFEGLKLLLIEDDSMLLEATKTILERMDIHVLTAGNGHDAINDFSRYGDTLDLVILDSILPDIEGLKVFEQIRSMNKKIKVLMTTSFNDPTIMEAKSVFNQLKLMHKPYTSKELMKAIAQTVYE